MYKVFFFKCYFCHFILQKKAILIFQVVFDDIFKIRSQSILRNPRDHLGVGEDIPRHRAYKRLSQDWHPTSPTSRPLLTCSNMVTVLKGPGSLCPQCGKPISPPKQQTPAHFSGVSLDVTPSRKPSLTFPEIRLTHSPSCLLDGLPTRLETQCLEIGNGVLVSLFPVPMSKASLSFIHSIKSCVPVLGEKGRVREQKKETEMLPTSTRT